MKEASDGDDAGCYSFRGRIAADRCAVVDSISKQDALDLLIGRLARTGLAGEPAALALGIRQRELLQSTGIGLGIAIPHVRLAEAKDLVAAALLAREGIPDYETLDDEPVRFVMMIVARQDQHGLYLKMLSRLSSRLKSEAFRHTVFCAATPEALMQALCAE